MEKLEICKSELLREFKDLVNEIENEKELNFVYELLNYCQIKFSEL